ncbi:tRNA (uridine(34)/cytosine(34)/5-carboxymethylaminomethyluridine(34)-2'-O)-methyltransferase TrmL [Acidithiobacillus sp.]|uniref:tRNA (uridine(34)/cytosine(34)/5- carboxymethylaminomethyluridine(34)-2'-O)- methyltransferase TrmL n=1 Tax=Acidithiobacillus sp. TaxID=1872118 RepID=UPI001D02A570|nr:tRNA (uridine(34)/cytosine(34)/5-carboxymethylaminomethyluridine(34)-2'-O)-methyltransferase TrmL [Acidithiobacillus ferriphilus]MDA8245558.1 tRNA (uridine(34)/cytosine(34)/5-carboxymethylaminomethyluridine(34)-2'-O)-methyltransferase TrmL [Acidithiobacillus sp.]
MTPEPFLHVILYEPEIPPNTGNVIRLCANTGATLHLVEPLGFAWDDRRLRRAGLDYHEFAQVHRHADWAACLAFLDNARVFAFSTKGTQLYHDVAYQPGDALLFGPETRGLPASLLDSLPATQVLRQPMRPGQRSLNLSNACAVAVFEAWRQMDYRGGT